jgi:hypothetical protein
VLGFAVLCLGGGSGYIRIFQYTLEGALRFPAPETAKSGGTMNSPASFAELEHRWKSPSVATLLSVYQNQ